MHIGILKLWLDEQRTSHLKDAYSSNSNGGTISEKKSDKYSTLD